jgi:hypothetical protein
MMGAMTNEDKDRLSNQIDDEANEGRGYPEGRIIGRDSELETSSPPGPVCRFPSEEVCDEAGGCESEDKRWMTGDRGDEGIELGPAEIIDPASGGVVPKTQTTICDEHKAAYFKSGYEAGLRDEVDNAERRVREYMIRRFSAATMEAVIQALRTR